MNTWGLFGIVHLSSLILAVILLFALYFILKRRSETTKRVVLFLLSFSGIAAIIYNLLAWNSPLEYLPLHLCSINAILLPIAILSRNKVIGNMLLIWCLGALFALVMQFYPTSWEDLYGPVFLFYYLPHVLEFGIPLLLFKFGFFKKEAKYILTSLGLTIVIYTLVHFCNLLLNPYLVTLGLTDMYGAQVQVNYMYSIQPENPLLNVFWGIIPHSYWYMFLVFPILALYLAIIYFPQLLALKKRNKKHDLPQQ